MEWFEVPKEILERANCRSAQVNAEFEEEIRRYRESPVPPCSKEKAFKLLKRLYKKNVDEFWNEPVADTFRLLAKES